MSKEGGAGFNLCVYQQQKTEQGKVLGQGDGLCLAVWETSETGL